MPCDNYSEVTVNEEYAKVIDDIEILLHENECNAHIICGDFNTSYERDNAQTRCMVEFEERNNLCNAWWNTNSVRDYTYINHSLNHRSCIDHFIVSKNIYDLILKHFVHYDSTNPSNHSLIELEFLCETNYVHTNNTRPAANKKCMWTKANAGDLGMYKNELDDHLGNITIPSELLLCSDIECNNINHRKNIDRFYKDIIRCCIDAGVNTIPSSKSHKRLVPGWNDLVKPEREHSLFWHWI